MSNVPFLVFLLLVSMVTLLNIGNFLWASNLWKGYKKWKNKKITN